MEKRVLGRTGIEVGVVGLGGEGFEGKSPSECAAIVDRAFSAGTNFIDIYNSNPDVRSNVGAALSRYPRESFVVEGHICSMWDKGQYRRTRNIGQVKPAYEDFLKRMQLDYVDLGMIHYVDALDDFNKTFDGPVFEYAQQLKDRGIIRSIGLSTHNPDVALVAVQSGFVDVMLFSINPAYDMLPPDENVNILFDDSTFDREYHGIDPRREQLYTACENAGVALTVMKSLGGGMLLDAKSSPFGMAMIPVQCIHYCLTRPAVAAVMVGAASVDEVDAAVAYADATDEQRDYSRVLSHAMTGTLEGKCVYCGHCAPCTKGIDIALVGKYLDLAKAEGHVPETIREHYAVLAHKAGECTRCGRCEKNCPFGVHIIERMHEAAEMFE